MTYQCSNCFKTFDSVNKYHIHEQECMSDTVSIYSNVSRGSRTSQSSRSRRESESSPRRHSESSRHSLNHHSHSTQRRTSERSSSGRRSERSEAREQELREKYSNLKAEYRDLENRANIRTAQSVAENDKVVAELKLKHERDKSDIKRIMNKKFEDYKKELDARFDVTAIENQKIRLETALEAKKAEFLELLDKNKEIQETLKNERENLKRVTLEKQKVEKEFQNSKLEWEEKYKLFLSESDSKDSSTETKFQTMYADYLDKIKEINEECSRKIAGEQKKVLEAKEEYNKQYDKQVLENKKELDSVIQGKNREINSLKKRQEAEITVFEEKLKAKEREILETRKDIENLLKMKEKEIGGFYAKRMTDLEDRLSLSEDKHLKEVNKLQKIADAKDGAILKLSEDNDLLKIELREKERKFEAEKEDLKIEVRQMMASLPRHLQNEKMMNDTKARWQEEIARVRASVETKTQLVTEQKEKILELESSLRDTRTKLQDSKSLTDKVRSSFSLEINKMKGDHSLITREKSMMIESQTQRIKELEEMLNRKFMESMK